MLCCSCCILCRTLLVVPVWSCFRCCYHSNKRLLLLSVLLDFFLPRLFIKFLQFEDYYHLHLFIVLKILKEEWTGLTFLRLGTEFVVRQNSILLCFDQMTLGASLAIQLDYCVSWVFQSFKIKLKLLFLLFYDSFSWVSNLSHILRII